MSDRTDSFYPAEGAIHGYGAQLMVGDGASPESFEAIAAVVSITPGAMNTADIDRTHLRSPDAHREHMAGLRDSAAFTVEGIWLVDEQSQSNAGGGSGAFASGGLVAMWRARTTHNFKIALHDGGSPGTDWPFRGYVSQFQPGSITGDDKINFTASFQPTAAYDTLLPQGVMANATRGEFDLIVNEHAYTLTFKTEAVEALQRHFNPPDGVADLEVVLRRVMQGSVEHIVAFLWSCLQKHHPEVTLKATYGLIDDAGGLGEVMEHVNAVAETTQPDPRDVQELQAVTGRPRKAQGRRPSGTGANGSSRPAAVA